MGLLIAVVTCLLTALAAFSCSIHPEIPGQLWQEGHAIRKRFADKDHEFHGHDIAFVLHEKHANTFHHIAKRDLTSVTTNENAAGRLRLDLHSGHKLHLTLTKRAVVGEDTEFLYHTENGRVKREAPATDCYATGYEGDDIGNMASVSTCNGLHGTVSTGGLDYYIHPVEQDDEDHRVHILWSRSADPKKGGFILDDELVTDESIDYLTRKKREAEEDSFDAWKTEDSFVIEMAMFADARYWERLQELVPGREDEYMLVSMAAVGALYGDPAKVGYDMSIKVKLLEYWKVDPEGYNFVQDLATNLRQFCVLTRDQYQYDMHFLHTYVTEQDGPAAGIAYLGGVCKNTRCGNMKSAAPNRQNLMAHEIGHNLGFQHHEIADCPDDVKSLSGGFMGGGDPQNFSPCNKIELQTLFESGKGACLFEETAKTEVPKKYVSRPKVYPGQSRKPDELCELYAGNGFKYFQPFQTSGPGVCALFMCINSDKNSAGYRQIKQLNTAPRGFPCGNEMFCQGSNDCQTWDQDNIGWSVDSLRSIKQFPEWSKWNKRWGKCSRTCGGGVQFKERTCKYPKGVSLSPACEGPALQAKLCNKKACSDDDELTVEEIRKIRGDEVCSRFNEFQIILSGESGDDYLPESTKFIIRTLVEKYFTSKSCIVSCKRNPESNGNVDSIFPDGTPCLESTRSSYNLERFKIEMKCAKGVCMEFSDCRNNELKDACGICGGDAERCVTKTVEDDVAEGERIVLAIIPPGTTGIDIHAVKKGGRLELWTADGTPLISKDGQYPKGKYEDEKVVDYAGTAWSFDANRFLRAEGPTDVEVVVKLLREETPVSRVDISYLLLDFDLV